MNTDTHGWCRSRIATIIGVIVIIVATALVVSCERSAGYRDFLNHDQSYYTQVAEACNNLLARLPPGSTNKAAEWKIRGDDTSLRPILRELHATQIRVLSSFIDGTNYYAGGVSMAFGVSKDGWAIVWERNDYGNGNTPWELYLSDEGGQKIVFSTREPAWQTNKPSGPTN